MDNLTIDFDKWREPKPFGVSACIRVRNESQFMRAAVTSVLDFVSEVVLCVQPSDDDTLDIANDLADEHEKVKVYYYPLAPDWIDTKGFYEKNPDQPGHLVHMSNWALSKCRYSWILKIEGDVVALPTLHKFVNYAAGLNNPTYYGLVILNVAGKDMDKVSYENPRNGGWDEAIFPNNPDMVHFERQNKWEVAIPKIPTISLGWALMHLKRCKKGKDESWNGEHYIPFEKALVHEALREYNLKNPYPGQDGMPYGDPIIYDETWKRFL